MCGQTAYDWKTMPEVAPVRGTNTRRGTEATTRPRSVISPPSGRSSPATRRSVVVLPQPLGPRSVTPRPGGRPERRVIDGRGGAKSLVTLSSVRTVSTISAVAASGRPRLLHGRVGDVLRLDDLGQVLLGVDLETSRPGGATT